MVEVIGSNPIIFTKAHNILWENRGCILYLVVCSRGFFRFQGGFGERFGEHFGERIYKNLTRDIPERIKSSEKCVYVLPISFSELSPSHISTISRRTYIWQTVENVCRKSYCVRAGNSFLNSILLLCVFALHSVRSASAGMGIRLYSVFPPLRLAFLATTNPFSMRAVSTSHGQSPQKSCKNNAEM